MTAKDGVKDSIREGLLSVISKKKAPSPKYAVLFKTRLEIHDAAPDGTRLVSDDKPPHSYDMKEIASVEVAKQEDQEVLRIDIGGKHMNMTGENLRLWQEDLETCRKACASTSEDKATKTAGNETAAAQKAGDASSKAKPETAAKAKTAEEAPAKQTAEAAGTAKPEVASDKAKPDTAVKAKTDEKAPAKQTAEAAGTAKPEVATKAKAEGEAKQKAEKASNKAGPEAASIREGLLTIVNKKKAPSPKYVVLYKTRLEIHDAAPDGTRLASDDKPPHVYEMKDIASVEVAKQEEQEVIRMNIGGKHMSMTGENLRLWQEDLEKCRKACADAPEDKAAKTSKPETAAEAKTEAPGKQASEAAGTAKPEAATKAKAEGEAPAKQKAVEASSKTEPETATKAKTEGEAPAKQKADKASSKAEPETGTKAKAAGEAAPDTAAIREGLLNVVSKNKTVSPKYCVLFKTRFEFHAAAEDGTRLATDDKAPHAYDLKDIKSVEVVTEDQEMLRIDIGGKKMNLSGENLRLWRDDFEACRKAVVTAPTDKDAAAAKIQSLQRAKSNKEEVVRIKEEKKAAAPPADEAAAAQKATDPSSKKADPDTAAKAKASKEVASKEEAKEASSKAQPDTAAKDKTSKEDKDAAALKIQSLQRAKTNKEETQRVKEEKKAAAPPADEAAAAQKAKDASSKKAEPDTAAKAKASKEAASTEEAEEVSIKAEPDTAAKDNTSKDKEAAALKVQTIQRAQSNKMEVKRKKEEKKVAAPPADEAAAAQKAKDASSKKAEPDTAAKTEASKEVTSTEKAKEASSKAQPESDAKGKTEIVSADTQKPKDSSKTEPEAAAKAKTGEEAVASKSKIEDQSPSDKADNVEIHAQTIDVEAGFDVKQVGLSFEHMPPGPLIVKETMAGSWAREAGFAHGNEILLVNGKSPKEMVAKELKEAMQNRPIQFQLTRLVKTVEVVAGQDVKQVGISFEHLPPGRLIVNQCMPDSWAAKAGFAHGDEIMFVNGKSTDYMVAKELKEAMQKRPIHFRVIRGQAEEGASGALKIPTLNLVPKQEIHEDPDYQNLLEKKRMQAENAKQAQESPRSQLTRSLDDHEARERQIEAMERKAREDTLKALDKGLDKGVDKGVEKQSSFDEKLEKRRSIVDIYGKSWENSPAKRAMEETQATEQKDIGVDAAVKDNGGAAGSERSASPGKVKKHKKPKNPEVRALVEKTIHKLKAAAYSVGGKDWEDLLRRQDKDHSGELDWDEYYSMCRRVLKLTEHEKQLRAVFRFIDEDHSGSIAIDELIDMVQDEGEEAERTAWKEHLEARQKAQLLDALDADLATTPGGAKCNRSKAAGLIQDQWRKRCSMVVPAGPGRPALYNVVNTVVQYRRDGVLDAPHSFHNEIEAREHHPSIAAEEQVAALKIQGWHRKTVWRVCQTRKKEEIDKVARQAANARIKAKTGPKKQAKIAESVMEDEKEERLRKLAEEAATLRTTGFHRRKSGWRIAQDKSPDGLHSVLNTKKNEDKRVCECGNTLMPDALFCRKCGRKVEQETFAKSRRAARTTEANGDENIFGTPFSDVTELVEFFKHKSRESTSPGRPTSPMSPKSPPKSPGVFSPRANTRAALNAMHGRAPDLESFMRRVLQLEPDLTRAWRKVIDPDHAGFLTQQTFCTVCRKIQWNGKVQAAWAQLDTDGMEHVTLSELDWDAAELLGRFHGLLICRFGDVKSAIERLDLGEGVRLRCDEFKDMCFRAFPGKLAEHEDESLFEMFAESDTLGRRYFCEKAILWLDAISGNLPQVEGRVAPGSMANDVNEGANFLHSVIMKAKKKEQNTKVPLYERPGHKDEQGREKRRGTIHDKLYHHGMRMKERRETAVIQADRVAKAASVRTERTAHNAEAVIRLHRVHEEKARRHELKRQQDLRKVCPNLDNVGTRRKEVFERLTKPRAEVYPEKPVDSISSPPTSPSKSKRDKERSREDIWTRLHESHFERLKALAEKAYQQTVAKEEEFQEMQRALYPDGRRRDPEAMERLTQPRPSYGPPLDLPRKVLGAASLYRTSSREISPTKKEKTIGENGSVRGGDPYHHLKLYGDSEARKMNLKEMKQDKLMEEEFDYQMNNIHYNKVSDGTVFDRLHDMKKPPITDKYASYPIREAVLKWECLWRRQAMSQLASPIKDHGPPSAPRFATDRAEAYDSRDDEEDDESMYEDYDPRDFEGARRASVMNGMRMSMSRPSIQSLQGRASLVGGDGRASIAGGRHAYNPPDRSGRVSLIAVNPDLRSSTEAHDHELRNQKRMSTFSTVPEEELNRGSPSRPGRGGRRAG